MDLILWRHADAVDLREGGDDLERALTPKGERQAKRMAQWLARQLPSGARVLVSPAVRAQQTAAAMERRSRTVPELAPDGTVDALLAATRWPDAREPVLVIGHQPALGMAASYLLTGQATPMPLRKGGIIWLRRRQREGEFRVLLQAALSPDLV
jgi:phosphohistidine phosphatase